MRQKLDSRLTPSHFNVSKYTVSLPAVIFITRTRTGVVLRQKPKQSSDSKVSSTT